MDRNPMHVAMVPWVAVGHITPYIHVGNELAGRGHRVSLLLPEKAAVQLRHLNCHPDLLSFHVLAVPAVPGLPAGAQTASDVHISAAPLLAAAFDLTRRRVAEFLRGARPAVDAVLYDFAHWVPPLASEVGAAAVCFSVVSAASLAFALVPSRALAEEDLRTPPPGYPSPTVVLHGPEVRSILFLSQPFGDGGITFYDRVVVAMAGADALCVRTCSELEGRLCDYLAEQYGKPMLLTGPVLPPASEGPLEPRWARWLDSFEPGSVVFCAFGSQLILELAQFRELLLGLELTGYNFFVALKPPVGCDTVEEGFPAGFEERVRGRGRVFGGWVQQLQILAHPAVGCFVNHCGFGSMWESLTSESRIVLVPHLGDQILNARILAGELGVGVEVERDENGRFCKEGLSEAIRSVMERESEVGIQVKRNHDKWRRELTKPGFMSGYVDDFVQQLQDLVNQKKNSL